jgi:hypothetical protein
MPPTASEVVADRKIDAPISTSTALDPARLSAHIHGRRWRQYQPLIEVRVSPPVTRVFAAVVGQSLQDDARAEMCNI